VRAHGGATKQRSHTLNLLIIGMMIDVFAAQPPQSSFTRFVSRFDLKLQPAMRQLRQYMPREQVTFGCMRVAGEDERLYPLGLVGVQFGEYLIGVADDCSTAA
jgi:hypothetical protein